MRQGGFTLIEVLVAIAIGAILIVMAASSFASMTKDNQRLGTVNEVMSILEFARSEAIKRGTPISVCPANVAGTDCADTTTWEGGWIAFTDNDGDHTVDTANGDAILKTHEALPSTLTLRGGMRYTTFNPLGSALTANSWVLLCDTRGLGTQANVYARTVVVASGGRTRTCSPDPWDSTPVCPGTACP